MSKRLCAELSQPLPKMDFLLFFSSILLHASVMTRWI
jgi:hypothetical protein